MQETLIQENRRREERQIERERERGRQTDRERERDSEGARAHARGEPCTTNRATLYILLRYLHTAAEPRATEAAHLNVKTEDGRNDELSTVYTVSTVYTKVNYVLDLNVKMFIFQRGVFAALKRSQECSWKCR